MCFFFSIFSDYLFSPPRYPEDPRRISANGIVFPTFDWEGWDLDEITPDGEKEEKLKEEEEIKKKEDETKNKEDEEKKKQEEDEQEKKQQEEIKKRDEEEKKKQEEEKKKQEEEEKKKQEEEEKKKQEEEEKKKKEEEEKKKQEEEEKKKEEEEEKKKKEEAKQKKQEEDKKKQKGIILKFHTRYCFCFCFGINTKVLFCMLLLNLWCFCQTDTEDAITAKCFSYCEQNHLSFLTTGETESFVSSTSNVYDVVIYDLDKHVIIKNKSASIERIKKITSTINSMMSSTSTSSSLIILLTCISRVFRAVGTHVEDTIQTLEDDNNNDGWIYKEFYHVPDYKQFIHTTKPAKNVTMINEVPWVKAIVLCKNLTWNEDIDIKQACQSYFKDKYEQCSPIISNFEMVPSFMRIVDKARHSPHVQVKPSSTVNIILCKFFPHISSLIKPVGRIPKILCIDSGMFIIPLDIMLNFGVNVDVIEKNSDVWDSWHLKPNAKFLTKDNNVKKYSIKFRTLFEEIVNEGPYKKLLLNSQFVSNVKSEFNELLLAPKAVSTALKQTERNLIDEQILPYCYVCGSSDTNDIIDPQKQLRFMCNLCSHIDSVHFANPQPGSLNIYTCDLYYKYYSSSSLPLARSDPFWLTMASSLSFNNQFNQYHFNIHIKKNKHHFKSTVSLSSIKEGTSIKEGDTIGLLWGQVGTINVVKSKMEHTKKLLFPVIRLISDWNPSSQSSTISNTPYLLSSPYCYLSWIPSFHYSNRKTKPNVSFRINNKLIDHAIPNCALHSMMMPAGVVEVVAVS